MSNNIQNKSRKTYLRNKDYSRFLMYAATALSFISFMTTADGMTSVLGRDQLWKAYFISFGIQAIVLIIGTKMFKITNTLYSVYSKNIKWYRTLLFSFVTLLIIILYLLSIGFSSFFSYVFLANHAYQDVQYNDYNIAIDRFIVLEEKNLKDKNAAIGRILLSKIQVEASEFRSLIDLYHKEADDNLNKTIQNAGLIRNRTEEMPEECLLDAQTIIDSEGRNERYATKIRQYVNSINTIAMNYNDLYKRYEQMYNYLEPYLVIDEESSEPVDPNLAEQKIESIENEIATINALKESLSQNLDTDARINNYLRPAISSITTIFDKLIESYNSLKGVYQEIKNLDIGERNNINLRDFYSAIYSSNDYSESILNEAIDDLEIIVKEYLNSSETIDESVIKSVSSCIIYLREFKKCQKLEDQINEFELEVVNEKLVIIADDTSDNSTIQSNTEAPEKNSNDDTSIHEVSISEWKRIRRNDLAKFIVLLKSLPDVKLILQTDDPNEYWSESDSSFMQEFNDFTTSTLKAAYDLNRKTVEGINDVERAWNFIKSDFTFMAWFCLVIAIFMDLASFLIGIFIYYKEKEKDDSPITISE